MRKQSILLGVIAMVLASISEAAPVEWPVFSGGNGHFYEVVSVPSGILWPDAKSGVKRAKIEEFIVRGS